MRGKTQSIEIKKKKNQSGERGSGASDLKRRDVVFSIAAGQKKTELGGEGMCRGLKGRSFGAECAVIVTIRSTTLLVVKIHISKKECKKMSPFLALTETGWGGQAEKAEGREMVERIRGEEKGFHIRGIQIERRRNKFCMRHKKNGFGKMGEGAKGTLPRGLRRTDGRKMND